MIERLAESINAMPFGNIVLSIISAIICYALLWHLESDLTSAAFLFGGLSVWQFYIGVHLL